METTVYRALRPASQARSPMFSCFNESRPGLLVTRLRTVHPKGWVKNRLSRLRLKLVETRAQNTGTLLFGSLVFLALILP